MPRPRIDLDAFRDEIEHRITLGTIKASGMRPNHQWSVDQDNRSMASDSLQHYILFGVAKQSKRANLKKWVYPDANGERGEWSLDHVS
jgi:hypothetical protein